MNAQVLMLPLLMVFANCFTRPGFEHFQNFIIAHAALFGLRHCLTEIMRLTLGDKPLLVIIFPQRSGKKMNVFFSTDLEMEPERVMEISKRISAAQKGGLMFIMANQGEKF